MRATLLLRNAALITGLTGIMCASPVCGQETSRPGVNRPTFEGTWRLDKSSNRREVAGEITLLIQHNDPEIKVNRVYKSKLYTREEALTYYTDERGEENIETVYKLKSKTKRDGNKIVTSSPTKGYGDRFDGFKTVTWQISKDGNSIKETTTIRSTITPMELMRQPRKTTRTFVRVP